MGQLVSALPMMLPRQNVPHGLADVYQLYVKSLPADGILDNNSRSVVEVGESAEALFWPDTMSFLVLFTHIRASRMQLFSYEWRRSAVRKIPGVGGPVGYFTPYFTYACYLILYVCSFSSGAQVWIVMNE